MIPFHLTIVHHFQKPPYGGGNQFLLALKKTLEADGFCVLENTVTEKTRACLFNSFNFHFEQLYAIKQRYPELAMLHRIDGPIGVYRGHDDGTDRKIWQINHDLADATIFQSQYSLQKHRELGFEFTSPTVIHNAVDDQIFNRMGKIPFSTNRKIRLISTSWSDNPRKGGATYQWLDEHLDFGRYEYTFVGRLPEHVAQMKQIKVLPPVSSEALAELLKQHDIYLTASRNDSCSNALIEALSCGLPAIYVNSGGNPELVKEGGLGFEREEEIPALLGTLVERYDDVQRLISVASISQTAARYREVLHTIAPRPNVMSLMRICAAAFWRKIRGSQ